MLQPNLLLALGFMLQPNLLLATIGVGFHASTQPTTIFSSFISCQTAFSPLCRRDVEFFS
jgi:hypothetical protein